jgi:hypothetical protein
MAVVVAIVLGASALVVARQADQAWLLLTTGERVDGQISAAASRGQTTIDRSGFVVEEGGGRTTRIPFAQVALIDFTSGQRPTATELMALPATGHLLVMTNGSTRPGRLLDFTGNVVRWQPVRGQVVNVPMRDVHRIYLDLDRSYEIAQSGSWGQRRGGFGWWGRGGTAAPSGRAGSGSAGPTGSKADGGDDGGGRSKASGGGDGVEIAVLANRPWTDTGIGVRIGQMVRFEAEGRVLFSQSNQNITGPDGAHEGGPRFPVPALGVGGLMGKVGPTGRPFRIGSSREPIRMPATGRLMLGVNDDVYEDNSGAFQVHVIR